MEIRDIQLQDLFNDPAYPALRDEYSGESGNPELGRARISVDYYRAAEASGTFYCWRLRGRGAGRLGGVFYDRASALREVGRGSGFDLSHEGVEARRGGASAYAGGLQPG